ncbi:uncharacterized protein FOMMEDRAFT_164257 [Fomitiporia mediterranea MF3/22]|uniref:uncharacterized protein n=1 Tax=Fomitiporia mediterranea (strain MF3/22) TaxID=694068 RepID=UPI00044076DD|nr:uncharacterized protein FOMMEDRAFT_164257 [Fomitiporia mediterranea MF3/22]EJD07223.1 hypothetical protein FOMMEDRAFT_164257 [Fomitiporia mediterranea MF3/22]
MWGENVNVGTTLEGDSVNWEFVPATKCGSPGYYLYTAQIQKSPEDDREYRVIRLGNGLEAVVVRDGDAIAPVASLNIATGHFRDPLMGYWYSQEDMPGLAHLCENLTLSGLELDEEYTERVNYISDTSSSGLDTSCTFSVSSNHLADALERFSSVFCNPQFSTEIILRAIDKLDSKQSERPVDDERRIAAVENTLARPEHPLKKFGCDVAITKTREKLGEWWEKEYCADRMNLALIGKESLEELTHLVVKLFSRIKSGGQNSIQLSEQPYTKEELCKITYIETTDGAYRVKIKFSVPWQAPFWRFKPAYFIAYIIRHRGPGSLHAYLKSKGWISEKIVTGVVNIANGISFFEIELRLTKDGFENYRDVIFACFKFINFLRTSELPKFIQEEIIRLAQLSFRFSETDDTYDFAQILANSPNRIIPRAYILTGFSLTWDWDEKLVRKVLDELVIENSLIAIAAQAHHHEIGQTGPWLSESLYKTQYFVEEPSSDFISATKQPNDIQDFSLPQRNKFIPSNVDVQKVDVSQPQKRPALIKRTPLTELWYKKDDQFWSPNAWAKVFAWTPFASRTVRAKMLNRIFLLLAYDSITEHTYDAHRAGYNYFIGCEQGLDFTFMGYSDKLYDMARLVLEKTKNVEIKKDRLVAMIEEEEAALKKRLPRRLDLIPQDKLFHILEEHGPTTKEKLEALKGITVEELVEHVKKLFLKFRYTILVDGNLQKEDAFRFASLVEEVLGSNPVPEEKKTHGRTRILPKPCNYVCELLNPDPNKSGSSIAYYCQIDKRMDKHSNVVAFLLSEILDNFGTTADELLGKYDMSTRHDPATIGWYVVTRAKKDTKYLEQCVEQFLRQARVKLEEMSDARFEEHKKIQIHEWANCAKARDLRGEAIAFSYAIESEYYDFTRYEDYAKLGEGVTKQDVIDMFKEFIDPDTPTRSKLSVHVRSQKLPASEATVGQESVELDSKVVFIEEVDRFRESLALSGYRKPVQKFEVE